jgi:hypothetical protein
MVGSSQRIQRPVSKGMEGWLTTEVTERTESYKSRNSVLSGFSMVKTAFDV